MITQNEPSDIAESPRRGINATSIPASSLADSTKILKSKFSRSPQKFGLRRHSLQDNINYESVEYFCNNYPVKKSMETTDWRKAGVEAEVDWKQGMRQKKQVGGRGRVSLDYNFLTLLYSSLKNC